MIGNTDRDCSRCHGTGDASEGRICMACQGQGTVCRDHYEPDCLVCHDPGYEY